MTVYWLMFLLPALATLMPFRATARLNWAFWLMVGILFTYLIGLRHEVGGDWYPYRDNFNLVAEMPFMSALGYANIDPGFNFLSWLVAQAGLQIYTVNLICAMLFMGGLVVFCRSQPLPWLALAIAVPYLITVVAMGYTRQAAAQGILLVAITTLRNTSQIRFIVLVLLAATLHKTALLWLPVGLLVTTPHNSLKVFAGFAVLALVSLLILQERYDELWIQYVRMEMVSEGGPIRVWMNAVAAVVLLATRKQWRRRWPDTSLWMWLSLLALLFVPLVEMASTAVDRVAIYLIPLQLCVFSRLPVLMTNVVNRTGVVIGTLSGYAAVLWVWLNFAVYAQLWLPYNNVTFLPFLN